MFFIVWADYWEDTVLFWWIIESLVTQCTSLAESFGVDILVYIILDSSHTTYCACIQLHLFSSDCGL